MQTTAISPLAHWDRCYRDFPYYAKNTLKIATKESGGLVPFTLRRPQKIVHDKISKQLKEQGRVRAIILKARQEGISTYTAGRFFRAVHLRSHVKSMIVADQKDKGSVLFEMYERFYEEIPGDHKPKRKARAKGNNLALMNGSQIVVETAKDVTAGRASTIHRLHLSEVAFYENAHEVVSALQGGVPKFSGSEVILESTANGVGNFFHQTWLQAEAGNSSYIPIFLPWWIDPTYQMPQKLGREEREEFDATMTPWEEEMLSDGVEYEAGRHKLTREQLAWRRMVIADEGGSPEEAERKFKQEYPTTPREAFLATGNNFFDIKALERYEKDGVRPYEGRGNFVEDENGITLQPSERGWIRIWKPPDIDGSYVIGADTATGAKVPGLGQIGEDESGNSDFSCADVIDVVTMTQVAQFHARLDPDQYARQLDLLGRYYSVYQGQGEVRAALLAVEKNHHSGETVLRVLKEELRYPRLYYGRQMNRRHNKPTPMLGWRTSPENRMPMLDDLKRLVREDAIGILCKETIYEMQSFIVDEKGKPVAEEGAHDDRVLCLAIAIQAAKIMPAKKEASPPQSHTEPPPDYKPPAGFNH